MFAWKRRILMRVAALCLVVSGQGLSARGAEGGGVESAVNPTSKKINKATSQSRPTASRDQSVQQGDRQSGQSGEQGNKQNGQSGEQGDKQNGQAGEQGNYQNGQSGQQGSKQDGNTGDKKTTRPAGTTKPANS